MSICFSKRGSPWFLASRGCVAEDLPDKPNETFGSSMLFRLQFVDDKSLEGLGLCGSSSLTVTDFLIKHAMCQRSQFHRRGEGQTNLDITQDIILDRCESDGTENI